MKSNFTFNFLSERGRIISILSLFILALSVVQSQTNIHSGNFLIPKIMPNMAYAQVQGNKTAYVIIELRSNKSDYWLGEEITLSGKVKNGTMPLTQLPIFVALDDADGKQLLKAKVLSESPDGSFSYKTPSIYEHGLMTVTAQLEENSKAPDALISVKINNYFPLAITLGLIVSAFILLYIGYERDNFALVICAVVPVSAGFGVYALYPPSTDPFGQYAIGGALLAPLAGIVIEFMKKNQEARQELKGSVTQYRDENLRNEVKMLIRVYNELAQHYTIFTSNSFTADAHLVNKLSEEVRVGTMANLPALRISQYYRYVEDFNRLLIAYVNRTGELSDPARYAKFEGYFNEVKSAYERLETLLYVNIIYSVGEVQKEFFSFRDHPFPFRYSWPLLFLLLRAGALGNVHEREKVGSDLKEYHFKEEKDQSSWYNEIENKSTDVIHWINKNHIDIYEDGRPWKLMLIIDKEFQPQYRKLKEFIKKLNDEFDISDSLPVVYCQSSVIVPMNSKKTISLQASNSNTKKLRFVLKTDPANGNLFAFDPVGGTVEYEPTPDFVGEDSFFFAATDGLKESAVAKVVIVVRRIGL